MKVVIPSKARAATIAKQSLALFPDAYVIVDERERAAYARVVPRRRLLTHPGPPTLPRLAAIRNHILDTVKADVLVMADDDVFDLVALPGWSKRRFSDPQVAREVLENAAQCAIDAGCAMFGFNPSPNQLFYKPYAPITLHTWVGSVIGFVGEHGLRYDERLAMHDDIDISLSSLMRHRIVWRDDRWGFANHRITNGGGLAAYRSTAHYDAEHRLLKEKWGRYVNFTSRTFNSRRKGQGGSQAATTTTQVRVPRKQVVSSAALEARSRWQGHE